MIKHLGRATAFALIAGIVGIIVAPQVLAVAVFLAGHWLPTMAARILGHTAYEAGLWGSGLATWLVVQRIGWLRGKRFAISIVVSPAFLETALALSYGRVAPGFSTWTGLLVRLAVGAATCVVAYRLLLPTDSTPAIAAPESESSDAPATQPKEEDSPGGE